MGGNHWLDWYQVLIGSGDVGLRELLEKNLLGQYSINDPFDMEPLNITGFCLPPVRPSLPNVALHRTANQSSVSAWSFRATTVEDAAGAVNGSITGAGSFHTDKEDSPWWMVDLGQAFAIKEIWIYNRLDHPTVTRRFSEFSIEVSIDGFSWTQIYATDAPLAVGGADGHPFIFRVQSPTITRFVRIVLCGTDWLHLDEVEVFGLPQDGAGNIGEATAPVPMRLSENGPGTPRATVRPEYHGPPLAPGLAETALVSVNTITSDDGIPDQNRASNSRFSGPGPYNLEFGAGHLVSPQCRRTGSVRPEMSFPHPKILIVVRAGRDSLHRSWSHLCHQIVDVGVSTYDDTDWSGPDARYLHHAKGGKFQGMKKFFESFPDLLNEYDYVWSFEDDLLLPYISLNSALNLLAKFRFQLAAPSLSHDENFSSWGYEWLWRKFLNDRSTFGVILDAAPIVHTRPLGKGSLYKEGTITAAYEELETFIKKYGLDRNLEFRTLFGLTADKLPRLLTGDDLLQEMLSGYHQLLRYSYPNFIRCLEAISKDNRPIAVIDELRSLEGFAEVEKQSCHVSGQS